MPKERDRGEPVTPEEVRAFVTSVDTAGKMTIELFDVNGVPTVRVIAAVGGMVGLFACDRAQGLRDLAWMIEFIRNENDPPPRAVVDLEAWRRRRRR